jgi:hypothetical protein
VTGKRVEEKWGLGCVVAERCGGAEKRGRNSAPKPQNSSHLHAASKFFLTPLPHSPGIMAQGQLKKTKAPAPKLYCLPPSSVAFFIR